MIFNGGRESWEAAEQHDHRVGSVIAAVMAVLALAAVLLAGCHSWPDCRPGGDCTPHGWLD